MSKQTAGNGTPPASETVPEVDDAASVDQTEESALNDILSIVEGRNGQPPEPTAKPKAKAEGNAKGPNTVLSQLAEPDGDPEAEAPEEEKSAAEPEADASPETPDETDAGEPDAEDEATAEGDDGEDPKPPEGLTREAQHAFNRVVAKEKARRKELEGRIAELQPLADEVERLKAENAGLLEQASRPAEEECPKLLREAKTEAEVQKVETEARTYARWADRMLTRLQFNADTVGDALRKEGVNLGEFTAESMSEYLLRVKENAQEVLDMAPQRRERFSAARQFSEQEKRMTAEAAEHPKLAWLKRKDSPEMKQLNELASYFPEIRRKPNWVAILAAQVEGMKAIRAQTPVKPGAGPGLPAKRPVSGPLARPSSEPAPLPKRQARAAAAFSKLDKSPSEGAVVDAIASLLN